VNDLLSPNHSPTGYFGKPDARYTSALNRKPFVIGLGVSVLLIVIVVAGFRVKLWQRSADALETPKYPATPAAHAIISGESDGVIEAAVEPVSNVQKARLSTVSNNSELPVHINEESPNDIVLQRRLELEEKARLSGSRVGSTLVPATKPPRTSELESLLDKLPAGATTGSAGAEALLARLGGIAGGVAEGDPNNQAPKEQFLDPNRSTSYRLKERREASTNPFELKTGALIPCVMVGGINSDLPGVVRGQVSQNVFDTATGDHLLIPQGTFAIGRHDSRVSYGQSRILLAWNRLTYPDGSTHDIGTMPGADEGGYPGFSDEVDNHYLRIFGGAIFMSVMSAGIQLSQPDPQPFQGPSAQQTIAGAVGQNVGQLGIDLTRRNLNIQPTLKIHPGYRFNIIVTKDFSFSEAYTSKIPTPN
jgi:type IV secretory pathway VirB10-like protein